MRNRSKSILGLLHLCYSACSGFCGVGVVWFELHGWFGRRRVVNSNVQRSDQ